MGRQCASGLSLLLLAFRSAKTCCAHGLKGRPSLKFAPMLPKVASGGASGSAGGGGAPLPWAPARPPPPRPARLHTPEKSGFPSGVRGVGAFMSTLPSDVLGSPEEYLGHCANSETLPAMSASASGAATGAILPWKRKLLIYPVLIVDHRVRTRAAQQPPISPRPVWSERFR